MNSGISFRVFEFFWYFGLSVSTSKTPSLLYRRRGRLPSSFPLFFDDQRLRRVRKHRYLWFLIDDHTTFRVTVGEALAPGRPVPQNCDDSVVYPEEAYRGPKFPSTAH